MDFSLDSYNEFQSQYQNESDRTVGILASSFLDNHLEMIIRCKLADHKVADKIFDGYGPLATFSAKTDMALLLGLITERVHKDINLIRKIRNIFAHEAEKVGFEIDQVKGLCAKLWPAEGIPRSDGTKNRIEGAKAQFLHSVFLCILHIDTELKRTQKIKVPKFHFEEVVD